MELLLELNLLIVVLFLATICVSDIQHRIIPNKSIVFLFFIILPSIFMSGNTPNIIIFMAVLVVGLLISAVNIIGAGDIKLIAVLSLFFDGNGFSHFLFLTVMIGGLLALIGLIFFNKKTKLNGIPYAVAISPAFIFALN